MTSLEKDEGAPKQKTYNYMDLIQFEPEVKPLLSFLFSNSRIYGEALASNIIPRNKQSLNMGLEQLTEKSKLRCFNQRSCQRLRLLVDNLVKY